VHFILAYKRRKRVFCAGYFLLNNPSLSFSAATQYLLVAAAAIGLAGSDA